MKFILVGQPNSGKSTIFNEVVGYKAATSNFPGVTVEYTHGKINLAGETIEVIDMPGVYSLQTTDEAESVTAKYLAEDHQEELIINIIDASVLSRSLELTLQLAEFQKPMVVALNMMDEAEGKGIHIDEEKLSEILGVPVIKTVGKKGKGVYELFNAALRCYDSNTIPKIIKGTNGIENLILKIEDLLNGIEIHSKWNSRFTAIKIIEKDPWMNEYLKGKISSSVSKKIESLLKKFEQEEKRTSDFGISDIRHGMAFHIFEQVAKVGSPLKKDIRSKLDDVFMHPVLGYVFMVAAIYLIFSAIFTIGNSVEPIFLDNFEKLQNFLAASFGENTFIYSVLNGIVAGFGGGIGIVVPYLLPFFIFLSFLEDTGYLARIAYLIDNLMHKIGLHGLSVIPIVLGYGCTVPAILATRILKSPRDKFITATLATLVPCSARMTIIFGLVGFFISMKAAIFIYIFNILIVGLTGKILSKIMPEISPGLILEMPRYHIPSPKTILNKTWFRMKEFVIIAWPILIFGSIILEVITHFDLTTPINNFLAPFTSGVLGLPVVVGVTLLFGIMRKELALILLFTALGTNEVLTVMSLSQVIIFTIFVTFYVPCLATIAALGKELNYKNAALITAGTIFIAITLSLLIRVAAPIFNI